MSLIKSLIQHGDVDAISELKGLTERYGAQYRDLLPVPEELFTRLLIDPVPPAVPGPGRTVPEFLAAAEQRGWNSGDDSDEDDGKGPLFPLSLQQYVSQAKDILEGLCKEIVSKLQVGDLEASGLRVGDTNPVLIPRGSCFNIDIDWLSAVVKTADGETYRAVTISIIYDTLSPDEVDDKEFDRGASAKIYADKFFELVSFKVFKPVISTETCRRLRAWGKRNGYPLPQVGSVRRHIENDGRYEGSKGGRPRKSV